MRRLLFAAAALGATLVLGLGGTASSQGPAPADTWVVSGGAFGDPQVMATAIDGSTAYVGGVFGYVGPETGHLVSLDTAAGTLSTPWPLVGGRVHAVVADGSGGWFIGGDFDAIGTQSVSSLAHIKPDGSLDTAWAGGVGGTVLALAASGTTLYVGGEFLAEGTHEPDAPGLRADLTAFDITTGAVSPFESLMSVDAQAWVTTLELSGSTLYVGGSFATLGGQARANVGAFDLTTPSGTLTGWNPNVNGQVNAIAAGAGGRVYVGGAFDTANGDPTRGFAVAFDQTGALTDWNPDVLGEVDTLDLSGTHVYLGGEFGRVGAEDRRHLAAVDATSGVPTSWDPSVDGVVRTLAVSGSTVYAGGSFQSVHETIVRDNLAAFSTSGTGDPTPFAPVIGGEVDALVVAGSTVVAAGLFDSAGGSATPSLTPVRRDNVAAIDLATGRPTSWHASSGIVLALAIAGSKLITGGSEVAAFSRTTGDRADWHPQVFGDVAALAVRGETVYVGGQFRVGAGGPRDSLAAFDLNGDGTPLPWRPAVSKDGWARALDVIGGTIYIGGDFTSISGVPRSRLAAVDTSGAVTPWNPNASFTVYALTHVGSTVYAGGYFDTVNGGVARNGAAAFEAGGIGNVTPWNPNGGGILALAHTASTMYLGGYVDRTGCGSCPGVEAVSISSGATLDTWQPDPDNVVFALGIAPQGVVAGGFFTRLGSLLGPADLDGSYRSRFALVPALPDAPGVTVVPGDHSVTVGIESPAYLGGGAFGSYTVTSSPGGVTVGTVSGPVTLSGLANGTAYTISVTATTSAGTGPAAVATVTPHPAPGPPTDVSAVAGNGEATVSFAAPASNGGEAISSYTVTASPGGQTASGPSSPITVTGLRNGETYAFTVTAANSAGNGPASAPSAPVRPTEGGREEEPTPDTVPRPETPDVPTITTPRPPPPHHA